MRFVGVAALLCVALRGAAPDDAKDPKHDRSWAVVSGRAQGIRFEPMTRSDGVPTDRVYQVLQDRRGFTWFTTLTGFLVRYDGYQSLGYAGLPLVASTYTSIPLPGMLFEDRTGRLWVATDVLTRFEPNLGRFTTVLNPRAGPARPGIDKITAIRDGPGGALWVGMSSHDQTGEVSEPVIYEVNPATGKSVAHRIDPSLTGGKPVGIRAVEEDGRGRLWLGTTIGLMRFDPGTRAFRHFSHTHPGPRGLSNAFGRLVWDKTGHLWIRMPSGIERFDPETEVFDRFIATPLWNMTPDPDGRIWLWGGTAGLEVFDPSSPAETARRSVAYRTSLSPFDELSIPMLGSDRQGNIWVFLHPDYALYRYSPRTAKFGKHLAALNDPAALSGGMLTGFAEDRNGTIWIATHRGLNGLNPRTGEFTRIGRGTPKGKGLPSDHVTSVYEDRSGTLWVATDKDFMGRLEPATGRYQTFRLSQWSTWAIQSFFEDSQGRFWVGDQMGGVGLVDRQTGSVSREAKGFDTHEDRKGNIWFGAPPGLHKLDRAGVLRSIPLMKPGSANPLSLPIVRSIHEDSGGDLWLASTVGLFRFDPRTEQATRFTTADGLASANLSCILPDDDGNLWISSDRGISRFDQQRRRFYNYDERDGLQGNRFSPRACLKTQDGKLYFGGSLGFNSFYPRDILALDEDPPVILTSFQIKDRTAPVLDIDAVRLNHKQNGFSFEFAALNTASPWKMKYRYRLEDKETGWVEVDSAHRLARYTEVSPGEYVFRVEASTDGRSWGPNGAAFRVTIEPPWWGTLGARALAAFLVLAVLAGAYWLRVAALHRRQRQLTALVDRRTAELKQARDQAETANLAKSRFLATMSHELRTPLNAILGFSNLLRESGVTREQSEHVNIINRSGEHLLTLIDDVLDLAKIEAGKQELAVAPCDLISLVSDVVEMTRVRAHAKNLELVWEQPPDSPRYVRTDAPKLRQVLVNLLGNAVKFTEVGRVTLRASTTTAEDIGLRLRFEVEDTGIGIAAEDQMRVFQPFIQATHGGVQKGTGLGLTITRQFVEMMGGTIRLESAPGKGSLFRVEIPAEAAGESEAPVAREGPELCPVLEEGQPECRVLVVDDNVDNTAVLEEMLRRAGFQVRVAQNGALGVEQFQQWRPHFIWMDIRMPVMDGLEATRRIRELDGGRDVRIAAVTASAFKEERNAVISAGMDDFIRKPYRWNDIFECMSRHLGVRYVQNPVVAAESAGEPGLLRPAALAALPDPLRRELLDAVLSLDSRCVGPVIDRVRELDEPLASSLSWFAGRLNYTAILAAIEEAEQDEGHRHPAGKIRYDTPEPNQ